MSWTLCTVSTAGSQSSPMRPQNCSGSSWQLIFSTSLASPIFVVDHYSKYPETLLLPDNWHDCGQDESTDCSPTEHICDHVPFASSVMKPFASEWGVFISHYSPSYPQANEHVLNTCYKLPKTCSKMFINGSELRNMPVSGLEYAPPELLKVLCGTVSATSMALTPWQPSKILQKLKALQCWQKACYDNQAISLPRLIECVDADTYRMGTSTGYRNEDWPACIVETLNGNVYGRNKRYLRKDCSCAPPESAIVTSQLMF